MRKYAHVQPPVKVELTDMQKARHLQMPGPGIKVKVPLHLLPAYLELYGLGLIEGQPRPAVWQAPVLLVKRIKKEKKEG